MAVGARGGERLVARLREIAAKVAQPAQLRVGFLADARYPDGKSVAYIAAIQEFGATIQREAGEVTVFRKLNAEGGFLRGGRFVKRSQSNFSTTHAHGAYTIQIPPRPFFRRMIRSNRASWPAEIAQLLKRQHFDVVEVMRKMGDTIRGQLQQSIRDLTDPPLAASTIRKKSRGRVTKIAGILGPAKPLVASGHMLNSVDYEVTTT